MAPSSTQVLPMTTCRPSVVNGMSFPSHCEWHNLNINIYTNFSRDHIQISTGLVIVTSYIKLQIYIKFYKNMNYKLSIASLEDGSQLTSLIASYSPVADMLRDNALS